MAQPFLNQLEELVAVLDGGDGLVCKHFFSGAALYSGGRICASLTPQGLAFKLPESRSNELIDLEEGLPLRYFERSPVKKGYVLFPEFQGLSRSEIAARFRECITYAAESNA